MNRFFAQIAQFAGLLPSMPAATPSNGVARSLMESAEAGAGRNPHEAQELRSAAQAFLSVIR